MDKLKIIKEIENIDIPKILSDVVAIPSYENELGIVEYIAQRLKKLNIDYELTEVAPNRQNLIASIGNGKKSLIFNSHTDTVSSGKEENWSTNPFKLTEKDGKLYGLGSCDAKGSLVPMLVAFELLSAEQSLINGRLILQAVCCEETRGRGTLAEAKRGIKADAAIIGEPTELVPMIGHKGGLGLEITTFGKPAHASAPEEGINAISNMARLIQSLDNLADDISKRSDTLFGKASLAVTQINGGRATNIIPDQCSITIDRRLIPGETIDKARAEISAVIDKEKKNNHNFAVSIEQKIGINPCAISSEESIVQAVKDSIKEIIGDERKISGFKACCDMWCLVQHAGIPTIILGPGKLSMAHKVDEYISINELYEAAKIYTAIALNWLNEKSY